MNKKNISVAISLALILLMCFVLAQHSVVQSTVNIAEDSNFIVNLTISNPETVTNITQVNITLPTGVVFNGSGGSGAAINFSNLSQVLTWKANATVLIVLGNLTNATFNFNVSVATPGTYTLNITSLNSSGIYSSTVTLTVNDTTKPSLINFRYPANATNYSSTTMRFNISVTDNLNTSECYYSFTAGTLNYSMTRTNDSDFWAVNTTMSEWMHNLTFYCNDTTGNLNTSVMYYFGTDSVAPALVAFTNLTQVSTTGHNASKVTVNITNTTDANGGRVWWYNNSANVTTYEPYTNLTLADGNYTFIAYVNDSVGNMNYTSRTFVVDTLTPNVSFVSPVNTSIFADGNIAVNISAGDQNLLYTWWSNGTANKTYNATVSLGLKTGNYTFYAYANDSLNHRNFTTKWIQVVDTTAPASVTITSPTSGTVYTNNLVELNASTTANDTETWFYSLNGGANTTFTPNSSKTAGAIEGSNSIVIYVNDTTGNFNVTAAVAFTVNTSGGDDSGSGSSTAAGLTTYTLTDANLRNGLALVVAKNDQIKFTSSGSTHYVKYTAYDSASKTITVTVSSTPQTATIKEGESAKFDLNGDGTYDIRVAFAQFYGTAAKITVTQISEAVALAAPAEEGAAVDTGAAAADASETDVGMSTRSKILWAVVIVAVIVVAIVIYLSMKKNRYSSKGY